MASLKMMDLFQWPVLAVISSLVGQASASMGPWIDHQINTSICAWYQPRAALIRDTVYLDGGEIWWSTGLDDGTYGEPQNYGNIHGLILAYNLSQPYSTESNLTTLLLQESLAKTRAGQRIDDGHPNFYDGAMLANYDSFFMYGGAPFVIDKDDAPAANAVVDYQAYQYGTEKPLFAPGFEDTKLPDGVTRYIAYGGAVNAPSENKAWYFSGLTSPTRGPIYENPKSDLSDFAQNVSNTFVELDMAKQYSETWKNSTLPSSVQGRANPEVVWVPVGDQGILVVLGGVVFPAWASISEQSSGPTKSSSQSPIFMQAIDLYDIANDTWYQQPTKGGPDARTRGCAVVAHAADKSSFNVYYYGGFDGLHANETFYDDVWVLSLPSFTWTQLNRGNDAHARAGHKCFSPYPDQMMAFGGYTRAAGYSFDCLDQGPLVIFNLTTGAWMDSYDPAQYSDYGVPDMVQNAIGGNASGGATVTKPPDGWATSELEDVFATPYDMDKIQSFWPYDAASSPTSRPDQPKKDHAGDGSGLPSWGGPVLGTVLGVVVVSLAILVFCFWKRRGVFKKSPSRSSDEGVDRHVWSWMVKGSSGEKSPTMTTANEAVSPLSATPAITEPGYMRSTPSVTPTWPRIEAPDTCIYELANTSPPAELHGTGLTPVSMSGKRYPSELDSSASNSSTSNIGDTCRSSHEARKPSPHGLARADSALLGNHPGPTQPEQRIPSMLSAMDENPASSSSHARQLSAITVSSMGMHHDEGANRRPRRASVSRSSTSTSPVSPPTATEAPMEDLYATRDLVSPIQSCQSGDLGGCSDAKV